MSNLLTEKINEYHKIIGLSKKAPLKIKRRLLELGFTIGTSSRILRKSLLGRAYLVELRGFTLSMRKNILEYILVEK